MIFLAAPSLRIARFCEEVEAPNNVRLVGYLIRTEIPETATRIAAAAQS